MLFSSRAMKLVKFILPSSALLIVAISVLMGIALAQTEGNGGVEIVMAPNTTQANPKILTPGSTADFTVQVITNGQEITVAGISLTFDPQLLEVVDSSGNPATQIQPHQDNPLVQFTLENTADNTAGTIRYAVGSVIPAANDFNMATITFKAKQSFNPVTNPTQVVFLVDGGNETAVTKSCQQLLANTTDFIGAWIAATARAVEIVMIPATTQGSPNVMVPGGTQDYTVRVLTHGVEVTTAQLSMTFDTQYLEVVDSSGNPTTQIQPHPDNPLTQFTLENTADNTTGTIRYSVGSPAGVSSDFNLAIISFKAKANETPVGNPTQVAFLVDNGNQTAVSKSGQQLLANTSNFTGAYVSVVVSGRIVEIVMLPGTSQTTPRIIPPGGTDNFTVQVRPNGQEITAVTLSMTFDTQLLEVVDALPAPGVQIQPHQDNPLIQFTVENVVDNTNGTIRYTVGSQTPVSTDFNLAIITFRSRGPLTPVGTPSQVVFLVDNGNQTVASKSGQQYLKNASNFTGAWVRIAIVDSFPPGFPILVAPADNDLLTTSTPFFDWDPSTGDVASYRLQVALAAAGLNSGPYVVDEVVAHPTTEYQVPGTNALSDEGYQWRVVARDAALNQAPSEVRTFGIDLPPIVVPQVMRHW